MVGIHLEGETDGGEWIEVTSTEPQSYFNIKVSSFEANIVRIYGYNEHGLGLADVEVSSV